MTEPQPFLPKLGWQQGPEDPRTLKLATYTTDEMPPPPAEHDWHSRVERWPMHRNDRIGCCVLVSTAHLVQGWTLYAGGNEIVIPEEDVVAAYSAITGYDPKTGRNDNGTRSLDALNHWRKKGVGGRRIVAYVKLDHRDVNEMKTALHLFGGLYVAAQLPADARGQFARREVWKPTSGRGGYKGSWGGHAMHMGAYDAKHGVVSTWGRTQKFTWSWWRRYGSEAFAIVSADWLDRAGGRSPLGFDLDRLLTDLRRITTV